MALFRQKKKWVALWLGCLLVLGVLLSGCGASSSSSTAQTTGVHSANQSVSTNAQVEKQPGAQADDRSTVPTRDNGQSTIVGKQYLVKALKLTMQVKDTRTVAAALQQWLTNKDQNITSSGTTYQQFDEHNYNISLTFSVPATDYSDVYIYLRDYTSHKGGQLTEFSETVQDVTNTYVDVGSRLNNLRTEQGRLQTLLSQAQSLGDILSIESKLADVEGDIESYEAQQNTLNSQISFYNVTINLNPLTATSKQSPQTNEWSVGQVVQDAFKASLAFGQSVLTLLIWLLSFSLYLIPVAAIAWFAQRWRRMRSQNLVRPKVALSAETPSSAEAPE